MPGLHSALILHRGRPLAEVRFPGEDERWGSPLGVRAHGPDTLHDLRSVTKSIVALLYGIALDDGLVPPLDAVLVDQFPHYPDLAKEPERRKILIRHVLSMQMGTDWNENLPYTDPRNSEIAMELAADRFRFILDRPMVTRPGDRWNYSGGATALIARLIAKGTGRSIDAYARERLFAPLGITDFEWVKGADGVPSAASGLRMNIHDLVRIGLMIHDAGRFEGDQVVSESWLTAAFSPRADLQTGLRYGFFWWLHPAGDPPLGVAAAFGNGGQRLSVGLESGLTVVVLAGNYNDPEAWRIPVKVITDFAVPAIKDD
ncbi:MAG: serine hydrolase [Minwuia sp.]|nr:serine hydrolase [Minwuia sp.]